jgi:hypothetical protein
VVIKLYRFFTFSLPNFSFAVVKLSGGKTHPKPLRGGDEPAFAAENWTVSVPFGPSFFAWSMFVMGKAA